tara:strand:+ start:936 stop:2225 length:1290 start_codon:yes stop_codon:yes gene_type:complete
MNWSQVKNELLVLLEEYIQIDTSNPPGNEDVACRWLKNIVLKENIDYQIIPSGDNRSNFIASINPALPVEKKIILLNHIDVVPAEKHDWNFDPFSGKIQSNYIHGRGALDMKGMGIIELMTLMILNRENYSKRNIIFLASADEESGSKFGIEYLALHHPELFDANFVINEGGIGTINAFGKQEKIFNVGISEKSPCWLKVKVSGDAGHGSKQTFESANVKLVHALNKIINHKFNIQISEEVRQYYNLLKELDIIDDEINDQFFNSIIKHDSYANSILTNSVAITQLDAGYKNNVVPSMATASLDVRLVPGYDLEKFIDELKLIIDDQSVEIEKVFTSSTSTSPIDNTVYASIKKVVNQIVPDALVVPYVTTGFTDSRVFRRLGVPAYGFMPVLVSKDELRGIHGIDEKISLDNLLLGVKILYHLIHQLD